MQTIGKRPTLAFSTAVNAQTPRNAIQMMMGGVPWHGEDTINYMPPFGEVFSNNQLADLAIYLRSAYSKRAQWKTVNDSVVKIRKENDAR